MSAARREGKEPRYPLRREVTERIETALARLGYANSPGPLDIPRWKRVGRDVVWVLSALGRIGFALVEVFPTDTVDAYGAGWEKDQFWDTPSKNTRTAYAVVYASGELASKTKYYRASKAVEVGLALLASYEGAPTLESPKK